MSMVPLLLYGLALNSQMVCDAVSFADNPSALWVPLSGLKSGFAIGIEIKDSSLMVGGQKLPMLKLVGVDDWLVKISNLKRIGFETVWDDQEKQAELTFRYDSLIVTLRQKRVLITLGTQELKAYQGRFLVLKTNISSGSRARTPEGHFVVLAKQRMHYSSLYNRAPMPRSVQIHGNIFIHGFRDVPRYPASHGCIRLPVPAAMAFFDWVEVGVPIEID